MYINQSVKWFLGALLYCILISVSTSDKNLMNLDFVDFKETDWNVGVQNIDEIELDEEDNTILSNQAHLFDLRENTLRTALAKALSNSALRQKFVEIMPILRVLSPQQRLTLSALISAQVSAKPGGEIKLNQVKNMFGDSERKLMLPLVYDIANLIRTSAKKYIQLDLNTFQPQTSFSRRTIELTSEEIAEDHVQVDDVQNVTTSENVSNEHFFSAEILDAKSINEALQDTLIPQNNGRKRYRRSTSSNFIHKLIRSIPPSEDEINSQDNFSGKSLQLNTSSFLIPNEDQNSESNLTLQNKINSTLSYQEIEDLAFLDLNGTEIKSESANNNTNGNQEELPNPEGLIAGPYYRINGNKLRLPIPKIGSKRKRFQILRSKLPPITQNKCERFTASMCIRADDYPLEQIMGSIRRHKNAMSALLAEYYDKAHDIEHQGSFDELLPNNRRDDENELSPGGMCASIVTYARPQKARSASGEWKYIVNTGKHTQTLRFEKCSKPQESCSYLSRSYRSRCAQVYNYHRLLSWDKTRGLHVDIFKVPTCCSCRVDGFKERFATSVSKTKDSSSSYNQQIHSLLNDDLDYVDEEEDEDAFRYHFGKGYKQSGKSEHLYDPNELILGSTSVKSQVKVEGSPTVGSYLSPPAGRNDYSTQYVYKGRHPYKSSRVDLEISGSEITTDKEVNIYGTNTDKTRVRPKRKRIYSVPTVETVVYTSGKTTATKPTYFTTDGVSGPAYRIPTAPASSSSSTIEDQSSQNHHHHQHHINSIYGSKYSNHARAKVEVATAAPTTNANDSNKRINYSYHPIIDFFENHQKRNKQNDFPNYKHQSGPKVNSMTTSFSPTITNTRPAKLNPKDKLVTFAGGDGENEFVADLEQSWHPVVVNT